MKGLVLLNRIPYPTRDGGAIATMQTLKGLSKQKIQLDILSLNTNKHYFEPKEIPNSVLALGDWKFIKINTDIKLVDALINIFSNDSYNIQRFYSKDFEQELIKSLQLNNYDFILLEGLHIGVYCDKILKNSKSPIYLRAHNVEHIIWERLADETSNPLKNRYLNLLAKRLKSFEINLLNKITGTVCISKNDQEIFKSIVPNLNSLFYPTGVYLEEYPVYKPAESEINSIYHLGSLDWMPNIEGVKWFLESVFPIILNKKKDIHFYIAGRKIDNYFKSINHPNITVMENIEDSKQFAMEKKISIVPLHSGSGMRIKIMEGLVMGKVIVSTTVGAEGIEIQSGKNILIADEPEEFATQILKVLDSESLELEISSNARAFGIQEFSQEKWDEKLIEFLKK